VDAATLLSKGTLGLGQEENGSDRGIPQEFQGHSLQAQLSIKQEYQNTTSEKQ